MSVCEVEESFYFLSLFPQLDPILYVFSDGDRDQRSQH